MLAPTCSCCPTRHRPAGGPVVPVAIVDGTLQPINRPSLDQNKFYTGRKKGHALNHIVVCDWRGKWLYAKVGFAGKTHDALAFSNTELFAYWQRFFSPHQTMLADSGFIGYGLCTPHKASPHAALSTTEREHNKVVARHRIVIECSIGYTKSHWQILQGRWRWNLSRAPTVFLLCLQLTNLLYEWHGYLRGEKYQQQGNWEAWEAELGQRVAWDLANESAVSAVLENPAFYSSMEGN
jgi:hypothetical protein